MATESLFPFRFSASERRAVLVGRASEMHELERAYAIARDRKETRTVTVLGATGIGKTRLVRDFLVRMREMGGDAPRVYRGSTREGGPAYEVFARVLRGRFGIVESMDSEIAKAQVRAQLAAVLDDRKVGDVAYFLGQLLDLGFQNSPLIRAVENDPQQMRSMRRAVIKSFLETDASKGGGPLVLVFDDLQWAHDDSLELLSYLVESLRGPIFLVCMARPEMLARPDGWRRYGSERHAEIELGPLGDDDAAAVLRDLLAPCGSAPIDELLDNAVTLAGGNPALIEQVVRIYHETGVLVTTDDFDDEHWTAHPEKLTQVRLPLTVQDAVQARIAALVPEDREILERAAVMGGLFWLGGLVAMDRQMNAPPEVWEGGEAEDVARLRQRLSELVDRDYVLRLPDSTFAGDEEYVFKHNLEREALLRLTPPASARLYHRAIAEWLSFRTTVEASEEYLEMLARHREKAGAAALAAASFVQAGDVAKRRGANAKAAELYARGLRLLGECDHADEDLRLTTMHRYGDVLYALGRSEAALQTFVEMLARAWRLDLRRMGGTAHARIGRLLREMGRLSDASRQLTAALALFGQAQDDRGIAAVLDGIGKLHRLKGDQALALEYTLRSLALRRKVGDPPSIAVSLHRLGSIQNDAGNHRAAVEAFEQALRIRREAGDLVGVSATLTGLGVVARDVGEDKRAAALFQEAYEAAKETGDRNRTALILAHLGATHDRLGDVTMASSILRQAEDLTDELGDLPALAAALRTLGRHYFDRRDHARARQFLERAAKAFSEVPSPVELGITLRTLGETFAAQGQAHKTEAFDAMKRSIAIFEQVGNDAELARTCRAYALLLRRSPEHASDAATEAEARALDARADTIVSKVRPNSQLPGPQREGELAFAR